MDTAIKPVFGAELLQPLERIVDYPGLTFLDTNVFLPYQLTERIATAGSYRDLLRDDISALLQLNGALEQVLSHPHVLISSGVAHELTRADLVLSEKLTQLDVDKVNRLGIPPDHSLDEETALKAWYRQLLSMYLSAAEFRPGSTPELQQQHKELHRLIVKIEYKGRVKKVRPDEAQPPVFYAEPEADERLVTDAVFAAIHFPRRPVRIVSADPDICNLLTVAYQLLVSQDLEPYNAWIMDALDTNPIQLFFQDPRPEREQWNMYWLGRSTSDMIRHGPFEYRKHERGDRKEQSERSFSILRKRMREYVVTNGPS
ncbi:hypothetical protein HYS47_03245 [Candidatus Woesearchaeota archaeon]|nr:hypothetical protein [Candidatus Woesearchaeota archaeon]